MDLWALQPRGEKKSRQTNTSHCLTKTIFKTDTDTFKVIWFISFKADSFYLVFWYAMKLIWYANAVLLLYYRQQLF